ncbi:MAG: zinc ABC transporter substrate-binding protein [Candidatus Desantisbacteria bacterium]
MLKKIAVALIIFFLCASCDMAQNAKDKVEVVTTLFPIYDFAKQIGKEKVNVSLLLPPGVESHTFEPKPADIIRISKADIFIYTGKYMEPWVTDMLNAVSNKNLIVVDTSRGINLIDHDEESEYHEEGEHHEELAHHKGEHEHRHHHHGGKDPHIWLDLSQAQAMVDTIAKALAEKYPANSKYYLNNGREYNIKLADLDGRLKITLSTCKHRTIIYGGHFAFGYFARRYGLRHDSPYKGFSPNAEPTPKAIAELINKLKASKMKYLYYEELLSPKVARTIASETGVKLALLHGGHNISQDELNRGVTFIDIMEDNLKRLKVGLECQ